MFVGQRAGYRSDMLMKIYIALFRGINVGGNNILPMKDLVALLENLGSQSVKTYIQSGNAVFLNKAESTSQLTDRICVAIKESHGFEPQVFLMELDEMEKAITSNPFPEAESEPKTLHIYFLASVPKNPDLKMLESIKRDSERFNLMDKIFYLHAPNGVGSSKLAVRAEKSLGVAVTSRNWRSVCKILTIAKQYGR
jgi:uncharacterized protein (DUF1697 family)